MKLWTCNACINISDDDEILKTQSNYINHSDSDQGGSTATLMPWTTSTPRSHLRPLTIPIGATAATSDTDDELGDYWRDQPSLGRLPPSEARSSQGLNGRRSPIPDGRRSPLLVETLLKNSARSTSVSSFFESVDETGGWSQIWSGFLVCQRFGLLFGFWLDWRLDRGLV